MKLERLAISCGGTGGHFNPGLSVAREFKEGGGDPLLLLGGIHAKEQAATAAKFGIASLSIPSAPLSKNPFALASFAVRSSLGLLASLKAFKAFKPQAVLAMGSFASFPPAIAAAISKTPLFLHDGNAKVGRANKRLSRFAKAIALSFPAANASECNCPSILTGMPLRPEITGPQIDKAAAVAFLNSTFKSSLDPAKPLLLAFGGSLGAETINKGTPAAIKTLAGSLPQVIHLTGTGKLAETKARYEGYPGLALVMESCYDMARLYPAADIVVCRSGGSTVSELAVFGKYAILAPYPYASDSHQDDNAAWLASAGGAQILRDRDFTPEALAKLLRAWLADPVKYDDLGMNSKRIASPRASAKVLAMIENIALAASKARTEPQNP